VNAAFEAPYFTARACHALSQSEGIADEERAAFGARARAWFHQLDTPKDPFGPQSPL